MYNIENIGNNILTIISGIISSSLIIGYLEHQSIVNYYRSEDRPRMVYKLLEDKINEINQLYTSINFFSEMNQKEKIAYLSNLYDLIIYSDGDKLKEVDNKISSRWSHFYARKSAVFSLYYSIIIYLGIIILIIYIEMFNFKNFIKSAIIFTILYCICIKILDEYTDKLWLEINNLEVSSILTSKKANNIIKNLVLSMINTNFVYFAKEPE